MSRWGPIISMVLIALGVTAGLFIALTRPGTTPPSPSPAVTARSAAQIPSIPEGVTPVLARRLEEVTERVRREPTRSESWATLGATYDVHEMYVEAITCFEEAERLAPSDWRWPYFLGLSLRTIDHDGSLREFQRARLLQPDYAPLATHTGEALLTGGDLDGADAAFADAMRLDPSLAAASIGRGRVALERGDAQAAKGWLDDGIALVPNSPHANFVMSETLRQLGDEEAAATYLERAGGRAKREDIPDDLLTRWHWQLGVTIFWRKTRSEEYLRRGWTKRAEAEWTSYLEADPASARAWRELARIRERAQNFPGAVEAAERSLEIDPAQGQMRLGYGHMLARLGETERGLTEMRQAVNDLDRAEDARFRLAAILNAVADLDAQRGRFDLAAAHVEEAIVLIEGPDTDADLSAELHGRFEAFSAGRMPTKSTD